MYYTPMQKILANISKYLVLALLGCSLLLTWNDSILEFTNLSSTDESSSNTKPNNIWDSMSSEFKLDTKSQSAQVQAEIHKLLADQDKLYQILQAAGPYIYFIHQQTEARGLPAEIALIPVIESEYNPNDHSKKGATGLWQLMSGTAHELGVQVKTGYDGRRNVVASTKAALAYFRDLGTEFKGDWYLAIAAYNCGQVRVESTERKTGIHDFWNLPLPHETRDYVPKLLAVAAIIKNPAKYGVKLPTIINEPYFAELSVKKSVDLDKVAKSSGINIKTLKTLNPDYNQGETPKKGAYTTLLVPINKAPAVKAQLT